MNKNYLPLLALIAATVLLVTLTPRTPTDDIQYHSYLRQFNKPTPSPATLSYRITIFNQNLKTIQKHNADASQTYKMGINQFTDLTQE
jgi:hypothetical protein